MTRMRLFVATCILGIVTVGGVASQEKGDKKESKARGQLPQNWAKLGLTDEQKQTVYKTQTKYREQVDELEAKIKSLKEEEKKELAKILTPEQKKRLTEILTGEKATEKSEKK